MNNNNINRNENEIEDIVSKILTHSENEKIEIIFKIANSLSIISLHNLSKKLNPLFSVDFLSKLPDELAIKILTYTDYQTLKVISGVSKHWRKLSLDNSLWKYLYSEKWNSLAYVEKKINQYYPHFMEVQEELGLNKDCCNFYLNEILSILENLRLKECTGKYNYNCRNDQNNQNNILTDYKEEAKDIPGLWKAIYYLHTKLESNWNNKKYSIYSMKGHTDSIYCLQYDNEKIISGSRDQTVKVWNLNTNECIRTLKGHTGSVLSLQFDEDYLVTGSSDSTIILWNVKTYDIIRRITGHKDSVLSVRFNKSYIVSSSKDHSICIWNINTGEFVKKLEGNSSGANAIQLKGDTIVSASGDRIIRVWSLSTGLLIKKFEGHKRGITCLFFDGNIIISGSSDHTLKIWDIHTNRLLYTLNEHKEPVRTIQFDGKKIVSGSYDRTIKIWDFKTGQLLSSLNGHLSSIFCLQFSDSKIISCSSDKHIIKWDFSRDILNLFP